MSSESQAPCGGAGKAFSANSLSRCLKGQGFPELGTSTWVPSAKAGTGRPVKPEPALEEAAHLWPGPSARCPCPLKIRCCSVSTGRLFAAHRPTRPVPAGATCSPWLRGELAPPVSLTSAWLLWLLGLQKTQTHVFLSRHFPDCFPASGFVLLPQGEQEPTLTQGPGAALGRLAPTPSPPSLAPQLGAWRTKGSVLSSGLEQRACCRASPRGAAGQVQSQERACALRVPAWPPGPGCSCRAHGPLRCFCGVAVSPSASGPSRLSGLYFKHIFFFLSIFKEERKK